MRNNLYSKILVCGIILMFIGGALIPIITAEDLGGDSREKEQPCDPRNENMIDIIVELWKPDEVESYTVWLPVETVIEIDYLINDFKTGLFNAETFEETIGIYCDMILCLCELGLFNNETIVNQAQQLLISNKPVGFRSKEIVYSSFEERLESAKKPDKKAIIINQAIEFLDQLNILPLGVNPDDAQQILTNRETKTIDEGDSMPGDINFGTDENYLCLTAGVPRVSRFYNSVEILFNFLYELYLKLIEWAEENNFFENSPFDREFFEQIPDDIAYLFQLFSIHLHMPLGHLIGFGNGDKSPAIGWVHTVGLNGIKKWDGSFYGQITPFENLDPEIKNIGTVCFTGIKIIPYDLYIGAALWVKLGYQPPNNPDLTIQEPVTEPNINNENTQQPDISIFYDLFQQPVNTE